MHPDLPNANKPAAGGQLWLITMAVAVAGWLASVVWPSALVRLGIYDYGMRFLDSYAVLAALDAVRAGADPHVANPLDVLMRYHVYSDWWLALRWLGLTREHNLGVGLSWLAGFAVTVVVTMRPRRLGECVWLACLLVSPAVLLVVNRANNDLVIFILLGIAGWYAAAGGWRLLVSVGCLMLAVGLKYYPVVAVLPLLWVQPRRKMPAVFLGGLVAVVLVLASVWSELDRGRFPVGIGVHTMGAPILGRDLGWTDGESFLFGLLFLGLAALGLARTRLTEGLAREGDLRERMLAAIGAVVVLACFLAGVNYAYRWVFLLWPAFWMWRRLQQVDPASRWSRVVAGIGCGLVALAFWADGVFCLAINALPPKGGDWVNHVQGIYRLWTQPGQWLLMALLAGWLLEGVLAIIGTWWRERDVRPTSAR
jgi:hypothetical protein